MKRLLPISLLGAVCVLAPVAPFVFTACEPEPVKIVINMKSDLSTIIETITDANNALTRKLTMIESAISDGVADLPICLFPASAATSTAAACGQEK